MQLIEASRFSDLAKLALTNVIGPLESDKTEASSNHLPSSASLFINVFYEHVTRWIPDK